MFLNIKVIEVTFAAQGSIKGPDSKQFDKYVLIHAQTYLVKCLMQNCFILWHALDLP